MKIHPALLLLLAVPAFGAYSYYYSSSLTSIQTGSWYVNGTVTPTPDGIYSDTNGGGFLISKTAVPDGSSDYEVRTVVDLNNEDGGEFFHYLRATNDARYSGSYSDPSTGSFYAVRLLVSGGSAPPYSAGLTVFKRSGGNVTQLAQVDIEVSSEVEIRSIIRGSRLDVWVDGVWYLSVTDTSHSTGQPGIGVAGTYNTVSHVDLGALDTVAPSPVDAQSVATYALPNSVDMQWQGSADDANGIGVAHYLIYRGSQLLAETGTAEFTDDAVSPGQTYQYAIVARDFHLNDSVQTAFTVTTPPAGTIDPRRVGVRPTGAYWGASGEQLDMLSGNLNFTLPLGTAMGRGGSGVGFSLSYNSQLWRKDSAATWKLGRDVGYGFGWRLQVGSITPYWEGPFTLHHYTFIDSTGAEYRLDVSADGRIWTSREGIYVTYDRESNRLYFPDGSFWVMGCVAAGKEQDSGTRYPTIIQDSNGNQILVRYLHGNGSSWEDTSARIDEIEDVRASEGLDTYRSYFFTYNSDSIPHLTEIRSAMGLSMRYQFSYLSSQALNSPFSPPISFGTMHLLSSVTETGTYHSHQFSYASGGSGELIQVTFPYGGYLNWVYRDFTYLGSRTIREVYGRYLLKAVGATPTQHWLWRDDQVDATGTVHYIVALAGQDASGYHGHKIWNFAPTLGVWYTGLLQTFEEGPYLWQHPDRRQEYTWTQDAAGNPYVASVVTTLDPSTAYEKQSKTEQTLDTHGNVTQTKIYDYGNLVSPARTYTNTYLATSNYTTRRIYNRLLTSVVTDGTQQTTLVSNTYDGGSRTNRTGLRNHDSENYDRYFSYRGNVTQRVAGGLTTNISYDITGMMVSANDGQGHSVVIDPEPGRNNTVPGVITPNSQTSLGESLDYTSYNLVTVDTKPNNSTATTTYDGYGRPVSTTSPHGAVTTYTYSLSERWTKATTNGRWTKTSLDGLGRAVKVETGYGATTISSTDTEYDICACSPMGKVKRVSQPYAPGGTVYWTVYTYDDLGRTTSVTQPGNSGTTNYLYQGNTVTVTDPASHWKKYTTDVFGNLTKVTEPDPALGNVDTNYTYNVRNQLTNVSMPRGGTTQTRTFNIDLATGRLTSAVNSESGTVGYTYNADGTIATRTDAKNQQVQYSYDGFQRVTQIRHYPVAGGAEDTCQRVNFTYDSGTNAWGRLVSATWGGASCTGGAWSQSYQYDSPGSVTRKAQDGGGYSLQANYTYNNEGQLVSTQYPNSGPTFTYTFDSMGRPIKLTDNQGTPVDWVKDLLFSAAGQVTQMKYTRNTGGSLYYTETRSYNVLGQMTQIQVPGVLDRTYTFSSTNNDGRITQMADAVSGETVQYQYDSLKRLISASTTGPQWGQSFGYDGFGNLLNQVVTKGSAPSLYVTVDGTSNRITTGGYSYDSNGNLAAVPLMTLTHDVENRLVQAVHSVNGTERYVYDPANQRVWKQEPGRTLVYFYGVEGNLLATYGDGSNTDYNVYFGSKLVWAEASPGVAAGAVALDRLGSVVRHFPYGDEPSTTGQDRVKFATYYRDQTTTLDYAQNRYYARTIGRFTTVDPAEPGNPADPQSWNYYAYVQNDPVNLNDPTGFGPIILPPVVPGTNCSTAFINYAAQFGMTVQQLFDSGLGILGVMSFFEQQGTGSQADQNLWAALDWTFLNQWDLSASDKAWFYGPKSIPSSFAATITTGSARSQVFTRSGQLKTGFATQLLDILTGSPFSGLCEGLATAFDVAQGTIAAHNGAPVPGMFYIPNPVPGALVFGANGAVPSHEWYVIQTTIAVMQDRGNIWTFFGYQYNPPSPGFAGSSQRVAPPAAVRPPAGLGSGRVPPPPRLRP